MVTIMLVMMGMITTMIRVTTVTTVTTLSSKHAHYVPYNDNGTCNGTGAVDDVGTQLFRYHISPDQHSR